MKYTTERLDSIAAKLRGMPLIEKKNMEHSKKDAVRLLSKEIASMQKRGYTLDQISETLRGEGLEIATPTLKSYLQSTKIKKPVAQDTPPPPAEKSKAKSKAIFVPKPDSDEI